MSDYIDVLDYLANTDVPELNGYDFYKEIFPDNEVSGALHTDYSRSNGIFLYCAENGNLHRRIMFADTFEEDYVEYIEENSLTLCSGLSYCGRENKLEKASRMHALIFDLDLVGLREFKILQARWESAPNIIRSIPRPTFTILSGSGVHLYYLFDEPIYLFPNIKIQLKSLKYDLTNRIWDYGATSKSEKIQYQSINQSFRMVGSFNSKGKEPKLIRAFRTGETVSIDYLNQYVTDKNNRVDLQKPFSPTQYSLSEAREKFPEWYERVVVKGNRSIKKWKINEKVNGSDPYALYHWWISQKEKIVGGHRYFFLMCMAIYADKCNVPKKMLIDDMKKIFEEIAQIPHDNPLSADDMNSALEAYSKEYHTTTIETVSYWTGVKIKRNKRNSRPQSLHLAIARATKQLMKDSGVPLKGKEGRPKNSGTKYDMVVDYFKKNPDATAYRCAKDLGISYNTAKKYSTFQLDVLEEDDLKLMKKAGNLGVENKEHLW